MLSVVGVALVSERTHAHLEAATVERLGAMNGCLTRAATPAEISSTLWQFVLTWVVAQVTKRPAAQVMNRLQLMAKHVRQSRS